MEDKAIQIIQRSLPLFLKLGVKSLTMDDIARELGISKKTLYQYFADKNQLIIKVVEFDLHHDECQMHNSIQGTTNAIEEIFSVAACVIDQIKNIHPSIIFELKKYYPEAYAKFNEHKKGFILESVLNNIKRGIKEGLYATNFNAEIVARLYTSKVDTLFDVELFPPNKFKTEDIYKEMLMCHIKSLVNEKGLKIATQFLKSNAL